MPIEVVIHLSNIALLRETLKDIKRIKEENPYVKIRIEVQG